MRVSLFTIAAVLATAASATVSLQELGPRHNQQSLRAYNSSQEDATFATFTQQIDHTDPTKGCFEQRYWHNSRFWGGPGYPIFMVNVGEEDAEEYAWHLTNQSLAYLYAEKYQAAVILFERRCLPLGVGLCLLKSLF